MPRSSRSRIRGCLVAWCGEGAVRFYAAGESQLERRVRHGMRDHFFDANLLGRIVTDLQRIIGGTPFADEDRHANDPAVPGDLWDGPDGSVDGGRSH